MNLSPKPNPAGLLLEVSRHAAFELAPDEFLKRVAQSILQHTISDSVSITLSDPLTGKFYQVSEELGVGNEAIRSFVSRDILVRRVRYGHLELRSASNEIHRGDLLIAFDSLTEQLARFAELHSYRQQSIGLRREVEQVTTAVKESKAVARASNLLSAARNFAARAIRPAMPARLHPHRRPVLPIRRTLSPPLPIGAVSLQRQR